MDAILAAVKEHWGYDTLRPLQYEAMAAAAAGRDSLVVMPTGGGKSLCYQAPALLSDRITVVVSPLIALMKDQVDQLAARGIPSAFFNSSLTADDRRRVSHGLRGGTYRLLFVAPERFVSEPFLNLLERAGVGAFAIDEAHCISHWGHDFREDYRQLGLLKQRFARASVHAFTATATPRVRSDIIEQLGLHEPVALVGDFFRPNLHYRVCRRGEVLDDVLGVIRSHPREAGIVYCIRRADVDRLGVRLKAAGIRAIGYHAGMDDSARTLAQDAFAAGEVDVVVATVAFGMGIDRADIRFVVHAAMPKSIEHYQQETGRAGRDGQAAECALFYSGGDFGFWQRIIESSESADADEKIRMLSQMYRYCTGASCRHRTLVSYFGQEWPHASCGACDVCSGGLPVLPDATVVAQKIMSCVVRTGERFGAAYVVEVLRGALTERVVQRGHEGLSTFGLIPDQPVPVLMAWIDQLVDQGLLRRDGEYRVLKTTPAGWRVLRSQEEAVLYDIGGKPAKRRRRADRAKGSAGAAKFSGGETATDGASGPTPEPVLDAGGMALFDRLRALRRQIADECNVPAFMVCGDRTLRDMARRRPKTKDAMLDVHGIGKAKLDQYGDRFLDLIRSHAG